MNRLKSKILPIWAVAAVVLRRLWRTGIGPAASILTVAGILLLRQAIQGDGTLTGMVRIWLSYSIALVSFLISATTLLIGASAISLENAAGRLQLVRVKPITPLQIWLGNWLGLILLNAALLSVAGITLSICMWRFTCDTNRPQAELTELHNTLLTTHLSLPATALGNQAKDAAGVTVPLGGVSRWHITIPENIRDGHPGGLQFKFITARPDQTAAVSMEWSIGLQGTTRQQKLTASAPPRKPYRLELPADLLQPGQTLEITCANQNPETDTALLFPSEQGLILLAPVGGIAGNFLRAGLIMFARLAFLSALGLTAGAAFSFPVATLLSGAMPLLEALNQFRYSSAQHWLRIAFHSNADTWYSRILDMAVTAAGEIVRLLMPTFDRLDYVALLAGGRMIPWDAVGYAAAVLCFYIVLLATVGYWAQTRCQSWMSKT